MKETMQKTILTGIVFLTGIALSVVAGYYSIIGLTTLFAGAYWSIVIMGTVLEIGKLVSISWLYHNWDEATKLIKGYMIFAIGTLMLITSMGIFGFLSKAHIEQQLKLETGVSSEIRLIDNEIKIKEDAIQDIDKQISVIDDALNKMISSNQAKNSLAAADKQRKTRDSLVQRKNTFITELNLLKKKRIEYESEFKKIEAEVGPVKYIAELIYGQSDTKTLDIAVRYVIVLLILVFDPLAIVLLLAFNHSIRHKQDEVYLEFYAEPKVKRRYRRRHK
jgi:hypothetical protein